MGTKCYDYILADRIVIPEEQRAHYDESVVYLPNSYLPHDRQRIIATPAPVRTDCGLPAEGFVFCCFNATYKIGVDTFEVWMRLLREVEDSVLWLSAAPVGAVRNLRHEAEARGIEHMAQAAQLRWAGGGEADVGHGAIQAQASRSSASTRWVWASR